MKAAMKMNKLRVSTRGVWSGHGTARRPTEIFEVNDKNTAGEEKNE